MRSVLRQLGEVALHDRWKSELHRYRRKKLWASTLILLRELRRTRCMDSVKCSIAMSACVDSSQWAWALVLLENASLMCVVPDVVMYSIAISACAKAQLWETAAITLDRMPGLRVPPDAYSFNAAITACEKGHQWQPATLLLEGISLACLKPGTIAYNAAISACEKGGAWHCALRLLLEMTTHGIPRTAISFNAAISACEKGRAWQVALTLHYGMRSMCAEPTRISHGAAISACEKARRWEMALELLSSAPQDPTIRSAIITACERAWSWKFAVRLLVTSGHLPTNFGISCLTAVINACVRAGSHKIVATLVERYRLLACAGIGTVGDHPRQELVGAVGSLLGKGLPWFAFELRYFARVIHAPAHQALLQVDLAGMDRGLRNPLLRNVTDLGQLSSRLTLEAFVANTQPGKVRSARNPCGRV